PSETVERDDVGDPPIALRTRVEERLGGHGTRALVDVSCGVDRADGGRAALLDASAPGAYTAHAVDGGSLDGSGAVLGRNASRLDDRTGGDVAEGDDRVAELVGDLRGEETERVVLEDLLQRRGRTLLVGTRERNDVAFGVERASRHGLRGVIDPYRRCD